MVTAVSDHQNSLSVICHDGAIVLERHAAKKPDLSSSKRATPCRSRSDCAPARDTGGEMGAGSEAAECGRADLVPPRLLQVLAMRIKSTKSTSKITKAMKMVAAAKLKGAERMMMAARPFADGIGSVMSPVLSRKDDDEVPATSMLFAISSDKGLCGGINSRVVKEVKLTIGPKTLEEAPHLVVVGSKARDGLNRTHSKYIKTSIDETYGGPITFSLASFLAEQMLAKPVDQYTVLYNKYKSVIAFDVTPLTIKGPAVLGASGVLDE